MFEENRSNTEKCPQCGASIEAGKACPYCLLKMVSQSTEMLEADLESLPSDIGTTLDEKRRKPLEPDIEAVRVAFPQLEILEKVGRGGMGTVFKARQPKLERFVALKILSADLAAKPAFAERFAQEGKLLAKLSHPNIVTVYDYGEADGFYYLILEFVDGVNLRQAMREKKFSPEQALSIVPKICEALQYAHDEGVLHRDIKPENILLDVKSRVKIADFGIGKFLPNLSESESTSLTESPQSLGTETKTGQVLGTPNYMAPEQFDDPNHVDHRADIYSLGVVFYELLTGELPKGHFSLPSEKTPIDTSLDEIVLKALERERENRYQSIEEMKTELETVTSRIHFREPEAQAPVDIPPKKRGIWNRIKSMSTGAKILSLLLLVWIGFPCLILFGNYFFDVTLPAFGEMAIAPLIDAFINTNWIVQSIVIATTVIIFYALFSFWLKRRGKKIAERVRLEPKELNKENNIGSANVDTGRRRSCLYGCGLLLLLMILPLVFVLLTFPTLFLSHNRTMSHNQIPSENLVVDFSFNGADAVAPAVGVSIFGTLIMLMLFLIIVVGIVVLIVLLVKQISSRTRENGSVSGGANTVMSTKFCTNCGASVVDGAFACTKCGFATRQKRSYCFNCGVKTDPEQIMCTECGASLGSSTSASFPIIGGRKDRIIAGLLSILLGWIGIHKFYLESWGWGIVYLLCSWTAIPFIAGVIEGVLFLTMNDQTFDERYNQTLPSPFRW